ncbi:MAG: hypothetical protein ASARMPRED_007911 [Alectoria sarmentosa]|nr:MAG: hypothetical protein ASARMPRED_007911 [Alectoria sarmentosa]
MVGRFVSLPHPICFTLQGIENLIAHQFRVTPLLWEALQGVRTSLPGVTDHESVPDGNRRLVLIGGFAIGLKFAGNVNAGEEDAESFESIKVGLEKIFVPKNRHGKVIEAEVPIDATILAKQKKRESKGYSGIGWLDAVLRQGNEEEGSSSGGDEANSDVGQRDVEMEDELGLKNVSFLRLYWIFEEVERILNYHFMIRALLSEALQPSSTPHPQG